MRRDPRSRLRCADARSGRGAGANTWEKIVTWAESSRSAENLMRTQILVPLELNVSRQYPSTGGFVATQRDSNSFGHWKTRPPGFLHHLLCARMFIGRDWLMLY